MDWGIPEPTAMWISQYSIQAAASAAALVLYVLIIRIVFPVIQKGITRGKFKSDTAPKALRVVRIISGIITAAALLVIWGFDFSGLLLITTSIITLTGIALFASWSILSNVTAYFILVLHPSYRRGNFIRVFEADNYVEGYIADITLLSTKLVTEDREAVIYPNNLLLGRPALINPRDRLKGIGKLTPPAAPVGVNADPSAAAAGTAQRSASGAAEEQKP